MGSWNGWHSFGGRTDRPLCVAQYRDRLYVFCKGIADHAIYFSEVGVAAHWQEVPGNGRTTLGLAAAVHDDALHLFCKGEDEAIYFTTLEGSNWRGRWDVVPGGGLTDAELAAVTHPAGGDLHLFCKGLNGIVFHNFLSGSNWSAWQTYPSSNNLGATDAGPGAAYYANQGYVFAKGIDDKGVYFCSQSYFEQGGAEWLPVPPGNGTTLAGIRAAQYGAHLWVFAVGLDQRVYFNHRFGIDWATWRQLPGGGRTDQAVAVASFPHRNTNEVGAGERIYLFVKGAADNGIYLDIFTASGADGAP